MSDATSRRLKVSREGIVLIKSFEGFRPRAVRDENGRWTIGYGHTASARDGLAVGEADAELLLQYDLLPVVKALNEQVSPPLNQHQFDALASFAISVGVERFLASDVLQRLNDGHVGEAADALIGWPETTPPDASLRRRAAERALFVADPDAPIHLAELLVAPLPPPPVEETAPPQAGEARTDVRAAAVAALLGEAAPAAPAPSEPPPPFEPAPLETATPVTTIHLQRYSPYAAPMIGPLPGFPAAATQQDREPNPPSEPAGEPSAETTVPTPPAPPAVEPADTRPTPPVVPESAEPVAPLVPPAPAASPFPPVDAPLVLTPPTEEDFAEPTRPASQPEQRAVGPDDGQALFDEGPTEPVMRHEVEAASSRRFDWSVKGAYVVMGLTGLAACAASAAAVRLAMVDDSSLNDYTVIAWVLAFIGVICVGVSSWNLFVRWGRRD